MLMLLIRVFCNVQCFIIIGIGLVWQFFLLRRNFLGEKNMHSTQHTYCAVLQYCTNKAQSTKRIVFCYSLVRFVCVYMCCFGKSFGLFCVLFCL